MSSKEALAVAGSISPYHLTPASYDFLRRVAYTEGFYYRSQRDGCILIQPWRAYQYVIFDGYSPWDVIKLRELADVRVFLLQALRICPPGHWLRFRSTARRLPNFVTYSWREPDV